MRRRNDVHVPVTIHVGDLGIQGAVRAGSDVGLRPRGVGSPIVFKPVDGVVITGSRHDIEVAVTVHVSNTQAARAIDIGHNIGITPGWVTGAVVLIPGNGIVGV